MTSEQDLQDLINHSVSHSPTNLIVPNQAIFDRILLHARRPEANRPQVYTPTILSYSPEQLDKVGLSYSQPIDLKQWLGNMITGLGLKGPIGVDGLQIGSDEPDWHFYQLYVRRNRPVLTKYGYSTYTPAPARHFAVDWTEDQKEYQLRPAPEGMLENVPIQFYFYAYLQLCLARSQSLPDERKIKFEQIKRRQPEDW